MSRPDEQENEFFVREEGTRSAHLVERALNSQTTEFTSSQSR